MSELHTTEEGGRPSGASPQPLGDRATLAEWIALCKDRLGGLRAPKSVEFRDELPRNATGKVLKRALRAPYWEGRQRSI